MSATDMRRTRSRIEVKMKLPGLVRPVFRPAMKQAYSSFHFSFDSPLASQKKSGNHLLLGQLAAVIKSGPSNQRLVHSSPRYTEDGEEGYLLLAVVVLVALVLIALAVAAPIIAKDLRRDKEVESEHRAEQYVRAIRLYYRKTHSYPPSMDALLKGTNNIRYLRENYVDPLTGKADWRIIHQPKTKTHYPFGQELSGLSGGGLGSAAGLASGIGTPVGGSTTTVSQTSGLTAGLAGASVASPTNTTAGGTAAGTNGTSGTPGSSSSSSGTGMFGDSSGGVIYGVGPNRTGDSILTPNQQTTYETWEFWYDPLIEQLYAKGNPLGGGGLGSQSATSFGQNGVTGQPNTPASGSTTTPSTPQSGTTP